MNGKFIVLEGMDGSGTTTQANLLKSYLDSQSKNTVISSEPTDGEIGKLLRLALKNNVFSFKDQQQFDKQMALLFAADRYYHLFNQPNGVLNLLEKNINVISTRYYFSSIAYNSHTPEDFNWVKHLNSNFPKPDILLYIDIPVELSLERISKRQYLEVYENREKLLKVNENYLKILENYSGLLLIVNGRESIDKIHRNIVKYIEKII